MRPRALFLYLFAVAVCGRAESQTDAPVENSAPTTLTTEEERQQAQELRLFDEYARAIHDQIQRNWDRPLTAQPGLECVVKVTQLPSGDVVDIFFERCNGDDVVRRSIEVAVQRASPLPLAPLPSLFNADVTVIFRPEL
jgi:colicin import membrane protein